jgi:hypothetical protein
MRATNVLARFASLLDVIIILLGLMMVMLSAAELTELETEPSEEIIEPTAGREEFDLMQKVMEKHLNPILLYAGCEGDKKGRCFLLEGNFEPGREIAIDSNRDLQRLVEESPSRRPVILLLSPEGAWDADWGESQIERIEENWGYPIIRVLNVDFPE